MHSTAYHVSLSHANTVFNLYALTLLLNGHSLSEIDFTSKMNNSSETSKFRKLVITENNYKIKAGIRS